MRHYLITGGAGFIGSHFIRSVFAEEKDIHISCIDDFDPFYSSALKELNIRDFKDHPSFRLLRNDLATTSAKELDELITYVKASCFSLERVVLRFSSSNSYSS